MSKKQVIQSSLGKRLFIRNLSSETTEAELYDLFGGSGQVRMIFFPPQHQTGDRRIYCIIDMETVEMAREALKKFNGHRLHGHPIQVFETGSVDHSLSAL